MSKKITVAALAAAVLLLSACAPTATEKEPAQSEESVSEERASSSETGNLSKKAAKAVAESNDDTPILFDGPISKGGAPGAKELPNVSEIPVKGEGEDFKSLKIRTFFAATPNGERRACLVATNEGKNCIDITIEGTCKDAEEKPVARGKTAILALGPGSSSYAALNFVESDIEPALHVKTSSPSSYHDLRPQIPADIRGHGKDLLVTATNTSRTPAYMSALLVFMKDGKIADANILYFVDEIRDKMESGQTVDADAEQIFRNKPPEYDKAVLVINAYGK